MNIRALLTINAILAIVHGLAFLIVPVFALGFYGMATGASEQVMGQLFATELLMLALLCWYGRDLTDGAALRAIAIANTIPNGVGVYVTLRATLVGEMNVMGWLGVAIYAGLCVGYATAHLRLRQAV